MSQHNNRKPSCPACHNNTLVQKRKDDKELFECTYCHEKVNVDPEEEADAAIYDDPDFFAGGFDY